MHVLLYRTVAYAAVDGNYYMYVNVINQQLSNYFTKQMNLQKDILYTNIMYPEAFTGVKMPMREGERGGCCTWITKLTFNKHQDVWLQCAAGKL